MRVSGVVQDTTTYDGFGNIPSESNPSFGDRYKYTGKERDAGLSTDEAAALAELGAAPRANGKRLPPYPSRLLLRIMAVPLG